MYTGLFWTRHEKDVPWLVIENLWNSCCYFSRSKPVNLSVISKEHNNKLKTKYWITNDQDTDSSKIGFVFWQGLYIAFYWSQTIWNTFKIHSLSPFRLYDLSLSIIFSLCSSLWTITLTFVQTSKRTIRFKWISPQMFASFWIQKMILWIIFAVSNPLLRQMSYISWYISCKVQCVWLKVHDSVTFVSYHPSLGY